MRVRAYVESAFEADHRRYLNVIALVEVDGRVAVGDTNRKLSYG